MEINPDFRAYYAVPREWCLCYPLLMVSVWTSCFVTQLGPHCSRSVEVQFQLLFLTPLSPYSWYVQNIYSTMSNQFVFSFLHKLCNGKIPDLLKKKFPALSYFRFLHNYIQRNLMLWDECLMSLYNFHCNYPNCLYNVDISLRTISSLNICTLLTYLYPFISQFISRSF